MPEPIGKYGMMHLESLTENRPDMLEEFRKAGEVEAHLQEIDQSAREMKALVLKQMLEANPGQSAGHNAMTERMAEEVGLDDLELVQSKEDEQADRDGYTD